MDELLAHLKMLQHGAYPMTGQLIEADSVVFTNDGVRVLARLISELEGYNDAVVSKALRSRCPSTQKPAEVERRKSTKISDQDRMKRNIKEGRPARVGFPWGEEESRAIAECYSGLESVPGLAEDVQRSALSVAYQLLKMGKIKEHECKMFRE